MIPKIIHYCWFGRIEKTNLVKKCIKSWQKHCPDFEIIEWNEDNFDINYNSYTKWCYENKKYAFLSDYIRLFVVAKYGGVYFDTDVELLKSLEKLIENDAFFGFENEKYVNTGLGFGSVANGIVIEAMLSEYDKILDGTKDLIKCPELNTKALKKFGLKEDGSLQKINGATIYPIEYFNPYESSTGRLKMTNNTISIHWYAGSWMKNKQKIRSLFTRPLHRVFGVECFRRFR